MTDPATLTVATITALAASKFVGKAAEKAAEVVAPAVLDQSGKQVEKLWGAIKGFFQKQKHGKAEAALAKVEAGDDGALTKLEVYLDDALEEPQHQAFATELQQLAQQIVNVQQQVQDSTMMSQDISDNAKGYQIKADRIDRIGDDYGR